MADRSERIKTATPLGAHGVADAGVADAGVADAAAGSALGVAGLRTQSHHASAERIYASIMRGGGEPFGAPFGVGLQSLTERIVRFFRQKSFFGFEAIERLRPRNRRNKFTRHAAARFRGRYEGGAAAAAAAQPAASGRQRGRRAPVA